MKRLLLAMLLLCAGAAQATNLDYSVGSTQGGGSSLVVPVSVSDVPSSGSVFFGQITIDYDSTEVRYSSVATAGGTYGLFVNDNNICCGFTEEQGNRHVLIQWQHAGFTAPQQILSVTFDKVACGAATLHVDDVEVDGNAPTHALTTAPLVRFDSQAGNMTTYDGYLTFQCGGGGGELDKPTPPATWTSVRSLYQ